MTIMMMLAEMAVECIARILAQQLAARGATFDVLRIAYGA
jgi:hypothetical protein